MRTAGLLLLCLATAPFLCGQTPSLEVPGKEAQESSAGVLAVEPGPLELRLRTPGARRAWLYYLPEAGEERRYCFPAPSDEFTYSWSVETGTAGSLYLAAEDAEGKLAYSRPLRVESLSYQALEQAAAPDPQLRVEVNLPAFELSVYRGNELLRRFRVGIGVKQWPVPPGLRLARHIVWNPEWAPPNSPWATPALVRQLKARGGVLGRIKIPLGGEILIHGTSRPSDLGRLVSHGCIRMLNRDIRQLAQLLIAETQAPASRAQIRRAENSRAAHYAVTLPRPVVVAIRYEPVMVRAGSVAVYPDPYGWAPVTPEIVAAARAVAEPEIVQSPSRRAGTKVQSSGRLRKSRKVGS